jgi:hypothetical protein
MTDSPAQGLETVRSGEFGPQAYLRETDNPGMDGVGFKLAGDAALDSFTKRTEAAGVKVDDVKAGEQPGIAKQTNVRRA